MTHPVLRLLLALALSVACTATVWAQGQGMPQEDPKKKQQSPPPVTNTFNLLIEQHTGNPSLILKQEYDLGQQDNDGLRFQGRAILFNEPMPDNDPLPQNLGVNLRVSLLTVTVPAGPNSRFDPVAQAQPGNGSIIGGGSETGHSPPIISKSMAITASGSSISSESDVGSFAGPELTYALMKDLSEWKLTRWLPEATSWEIYGRAQTGSLELFDESVSAKLYGVGFRLNVPFYRSESFRADGTLSAGPGYLATDLGDALAFDGSVGLRLVQVLGSGVSLVGCAEFQILQSKDTAASGPSFNVGLNFSW